jgi:endonuclease G
VHKIAKVSLITGLLVACVPIPTPASTDDKYPEIHCKHFFYGCPTGTPATNDLIIRDDYALSSNDETKFADWVAYRLDATTIEGNVETARNWMTDPWLAPEETLEAKPDDYTGANAALGVDRGHQAPLASFKGTLVWWETNYYSNITPQMAPLNQGPWVKIEEMERDLARAGDVVYVMTGPLYERDMPPLPEADESHRVPSGYWKIVATQSGEDYDSIRVVAFIFDQETPRDDPVVNHFVTIDDVEARSALDVMWELPDDFEEAIEARLDTEWTNDNF